jgi:ADP-heptose:LPS heptosyltransferase
VAIVLLGAASDRELCRAIVAELGSGYDLSGKLSLAQSAAVLERAERFYGIDSLLLHLARALNVPATSVWGPTEPESRLRARAAEDEVFYSRIACSPCVHVHDTPPCKGARICIPAALAAAPKPVAPLSRVVSVGWVIGPNDRDYRLVEVFNDSPATPQRSLSRAHNE